MSVLEAGRRASRPRRAPPRPRRPPPAPVPAWRPRRSRRFGRRRLGGGGHLGGDLAGPFQRANLGLGADRRPSRPHRRSRRPPSRPAGWTRPSDWRRSRPSPSCGRCRRRSGQVVPHPGTRGRAVMVRAGGELDGEIAGGDLLGSAGHLVEVVDRGLERGREPSDLVVGGDHRVVIARLPCASFSAASVTTERGR